ncbi:Conjugal transfer protein TraG [Defluviimonas aquaemixtae]|uniref:Conjugal transfer protein TraG n=1 Tax=Albidovulum aquaemixtae TaxID=1542388 RepID=A0A2R8B5N0_9RHOB|nr:type IV secretory system conjugative DNA transfer family protein [Defluviimonas aquaemixtae]SPH17907.1 Conjugal transfer protein TraG [Defluviimonas aquaemixtae]
MDFSQVESWIIAGAAFVTVAALLAWRFDGKKADTHGAARWCTVWEAFRAKLFGSQGLYVGDWKGRLAVRYNGAHALSVGVTGCGKGTSAILPNLLEQKFLFVVDPGGENTATACKAWRRGGMNFRCINPFAMFTEAPYALPAHGFNPLAAIDPAAPSFAADALLIAEMLTPRQANEGGNTSYFKDAATSAKRAMIVHIKTSEPAERQNIGTLYDYAYADADGWDALIAAMKANPACGRLTAFEANRLERTEAQSPEEFSAIMSTIQQDLAFLADPQVRVTLSGNDVDFGMLKGTGAGRKGAVISVVMPLQYIESHAAITRLAMACAVLTLQRKPYARHKVLFLIDEAAALGQIKRLATWLATLRKYNVRFWTIWQSLAQVYGIYGNDWQAIVSNCELLQVLGVGDHYSARILSQMIGQSTIKTETRNARGEISVSHTARPLIMPEELLRTAGGEQIVLMGRMWPLVLKKTPYWKQPRFRGRYHNNPYLIRRTPDPNSFDELASLWGRIYYMLAWWMAPHPLAACMITAALGLGLWHLFGGAV